MIPKDIDFYALLLASVVWIQTNLGAYLSVGFLVMLVWFRVWLTTTIRIEPNEKTNWILWGIPTAVFGVAWLLPSSLILTIAEVVVAAYCGVVRWYIKRQGSDAIKSLILSSNVVFGDDEGEGKNDEEKGGKGRSRESARRKVIKVAWGVKQMSWKSGVVPAFSTVYKFRMSPKPKSEEFVRVTERLGAYFPEFNFIGARKGKFYTVLCAIQAKPRVVKWDRSISDQLPWYIVPLGAMDPSSKKAAKESLYVWRLKDDSKQYRILKGKAKSLAAPHGFAAGSSGGGKAVSVSQRIKIRRPVESDHSEITWS